MKTKLIFLLLCGLICGCTNEPEEKQSLADVKWKLVEFVNADGTSKTPKTFSFGSYNSYWIIFNSDNTLVGMSSSNLILGHYEINQQLSGIQLNAHTATLAAELPDGELFLKNLNSSYRYTTTKNTLKLYHTEKDYLLFNVYEDEKK